MLLQYVLLHFKFAQHHLSAFKRMAYYISLFSPDTYDAFTHSDRSVSGFSERQKRIAEVLQPGDKLICYVTKLSRWVGVLEVTSGYFIEDNPRFTPAADPYIVRVRVNTKVWLPLEKAVPMEDGILWNNLSFTKNLPPKSVRWTGMVRSSLKKLTNQDGEYLEKVLMAQETNGIIYGLNETEQRKLKSLTVKTENNRLVVVSVPENEEDLQPKEMLPSSYLRESARIQALLAEIGERMGMKVWLPRSDRQKVLEYWKPKASCLLEQLPLNYDDVTLRTIENIDVLWIRGRSVIRAFEVEHTTSIYSGILRMADLMALQPNLNIKAHIVAPLERRQKVLQEITRPVFTFLEKGPLAESCTYISYESVEELSKEKRLEYMTDAVLEEYVEYAEEADV